MSRFLKYSKVTKLSKQEMQQIQMYYLTGTTNESLHKFLEIKKKEGGSEKRI